MNQKVFLSCLDGDAMATPSDLELVASVVRGGGVILYPTATLYGIGGDGFNAAVAMRVRDMKMRADTSFILLAADAESALALGREVPDRARDMAERFWPGPLTLVLPAAERVPVQVRGPADTVAVRVDAHPFTRALAKAAGCPIISTSANISGDPAAVGPNEVDPRLIAACDVFVVDDSPRAGLPSTLVAFHDGTPVILRQGAISGEML